MRTGLGAGGIAAIHPPVARIEVPVALVATEAATVPGDIGRIGPVDSVAVDLTPVTADLAAVSARLPPIVTGFGARSGRLGARRGGRGGGGSRGLSTADGGEAEGQDE